MLAIAPAIAHASPDAKGIRIGSGFLAPSNTDAFNNAQSTALNPQPGFEVGTYLTWRRSPTFAMQLEGLVSNKQMTSENCGMGQNGCTPLAKVSLWYLELPFLFRLDLLPGDTKLHLDAGPEAVLTLGGGMTPTDGSYQRFEDLLPFNVGAVVGAGLEFPVGPGKITFDVRYQRWLIDLTGSLDSNNPPPGFANGMSQIQPSHQLLAMVGYAFP